MEIVPGYELLEKLYEGFKTVVYLVEDENRNKFVVKTYNQEYLSIEDISNLKHEYLVIQGINIPGIIQNHKCIRSNKKIFLFKEYFDSISLKEYLVKNEIDLFSKLEISIQIAEIVSHLHKKNIIHKDINPGNILVNIKTKEIKLTDFSIASFLTKEKLELSSYQKLEGTPAYISPEQTGRINRNLDYRSDLYSIGVTLYELFTGELPFLSNDLSELIYCHISKLPKEPKAVSEDLPLIISNIIVKLLSKNAEDRYQSSKGLKFDLIKSLKYLRSFNKDLSFDVGAIDQSSTFLLPQKLYGRDKELSILLESLREVSLGHTQVVFLRGISGTGKTTLVRELYQSILEKKGFFIQGKFQQYKRDIPYQGIIQAFKSLIKILLIEHSDELDLWKSRLLSEVGSNIQILIDYLPELELLLGKQPKLSKLRAIETQNRFIIAFCEFIRVFSTKNHPLVVFIDDLQWADSSSLNLIQEIITNGKIKYLFFVTAYRSDDKSAENLLSYTINQIRSRCSTLNILDIKLLKLKDTKLFVSETLKCDIYHSSELAELLFKISKGNPLFLAQLLYSLYANNQIYFDFDEARWKWAIESLKSENISDKDIVDLFATKILTLPNKSQDVIKLASCIGSHFDLKTLSKIYGDIPSNTASILWPALQSEIIIPINQTYKLPVAFDDDSTVDQFAAAATISYQFLHDRVQQAAYSLIPDSDKQFFHQKIGDILLNKFEFKDKDDHIFDIVNQFNQCKSSIKHTLKRVELAKLNLLAGRKAKLAIAYVSSIKYLEAGLYLLNDQDWANNYELIFDLHLELLEAECFSINPNKIEELSLKIQENSKSLLDLVKIYELQVPYYFTQNNPKKSVSLALEILKSLGIKFPTYLNKVSLIIELIKIRIYQRNRTIEDLVDLPVNTDPYKVAAMKILMSVVPASYVSKPELYPFVITQMVLISLKYGNISISSFGYNNLGIIFSGLLRKYKLGYRLGKLALNIQDCFNADYMRSKNYLVFNNFIRHWQEPLQQSMEGLLEGIQFGLQTGDIENSCHCAAFYISQLFFSGEQLDLVNDKQISLLEMMNQYGQELDAKHTKLWIQVVYNLTENTDEFLCLDGEYFEEDIDLEKLVSSGSYLIVFPFYIAKLFLVCIFGDVSDAFELVIKSSRYRSSGIGLIYSSIFLFYSSLSLAMNFESVNQIDKKFISKTIFDALNEFKRLSFECKETYLNKYMLLNAEVSRLTKKVDKTLIFYNQAIQYSGQYGFIQEKALACERAATYSESIGMSQLTNVFIQEAYYAYLEWGASTKVKSLLDKYPFLDKNSKDSIYDNCSIDLSNISSLSSSLIDLDIASAIKASQAISSEIALDSLIQKLMQVLLESAGAQSGILVLFRHKELCIEAVAKASNNISIECNSIPLEGYDEAPKNVFSFVKLTHEKVVVNNPNENHQFLNDSYFLDRSPKSFLCMPILNQANLIGMVYLENSVSFDAFRFDRLELLNLLCSQAAISLNNSFLFSDLQISKEREQAEREINELKSRFISMTSHEFRTPLTAILGTTELIKHYGQGWSSEKQHSYLDRIQRNVKHMTGLLDDVLVLSKADVGKIEFTPAPIDLKVFCNNLVEEIQLNTKRGQIVELVIEGENYNSYSDEKILRQILSNLLSNAIKYSPENTVVRFDVTFSNEEVAFFIQDQGIGIPEADQQHLFESFHRATNVGQIQGTGLGLAIVKKSVEIHQGTITFESIPAQGTKFIVRLPVTAEALGIVSN